MLILQVLLHNKQVQRVTFVMHKINVSCDCERARDCDKLIDEVCQSECVKVLK